MDDGFTEKIVSKNEEPIKETQARGDFRPVINRGRIQTPSVIRNKLQRASAEQRYVAKVSDSGSPTVGESDSKKDDDVKEMIKDMEKKLGIVN